MTAVPVEPPERTRDDVIHDIDTLLTELDQVTKTDDDPDWVLTTWVAVQVWEKPNGDEAVSMDHRQYAMPRWKIRGLLHQGLVELDLEDD